MKKIFFVILMGITIGFLTSCMDRNEPVSASGVKKADANVVTQANGLTIEQENVKRRLEMENAPGNIQHLYIISAYTGQVLLYSTVKGKVTSSGKRLTPPDIYGSTASNELNGFQIYIGGKSYLTKYVLGDDGTYGSSMDYLFWWDVQGRYHQQYISGGVTVMISDTPLDGIKPLIYQAEVKK